MPKKTVQLPAHPPVTLDYSKQSEQRFTKPFQDEIYYER